MTDPASPDPSQPSAGDSDDELYASVVEKVNDGEAVDWRQLDRDHPELRHRWQGLRRVQEIGSAFRDACLDDEGGPVAARRARAFDADSQDDPSTWGPFEIREKIGEGTFGEVFRAHDPALRRDVALKLGKTDDLRRQRQFLEEGRRLAQVDHPGVVRVYGAAVHDGRPGVWMDLAAGRSLDRRLAEDGRFSERETVEVALQLSRALEAVHGAGLIHGDIKAANVLRQDGGTVLLGDFGASLDLRVGSGEPGCASPLTAAPEILRGETADGRADLYSLGALLFQVLTGEFPFEGRSLSELRDAHDERLPRSLRRLRPDVSRGLAAIVDKALARDPEQRWQSAQDLRDSLEELGSAGNPAESPSAAKPRRPNGRKWLPLVAVVTVLGAAVLGAAVLGIAALRLASKGADETGPATAPTTATTEESASAQTPLAGDLRIDLYRTGDDRPLRTGRTIRVGDALHLRVEGNDAPLWLYLANEDAAGAAYTLFPLTGVEPSNPLAPGALRLPGSLEGIEQDWVVTSEGKTESFLLVASREPLPELEKALEEIAQASAERAPNRAPPTFSFRTRGVGGLEPSVGAAVPEILLDLRRIAVEESTPYVEVVTLKGLGPPEP